MIGVILEDIYIEITINDEEIVGNGLGYYYWNDGEEIAINETYIKSYSIDQVKIIKNNLK